MSLRLPLSLIAVAISGSASADVLEGKPGAMLDLRDAKAHLQMVCDVDPGPRMSALSGDAIPDPDTSTWKFHFGEAPNGVNPNIDGRLRLKRQPDGSALLAYELTALQDQPLFDMYLSLAVPVRMYAGGSVTADGRTTAFDREYAGKGSPLVGSFRKLEFSDRDGIRRFAVEYPAPTRLAIRDSRSWGAQRLDLRVHLVDHGKIAKGEKFNLSFRLSVPGGFGDSFRKRVIEAGPDWIPMRWDREIAAGSACDFSGQIGLDAPAGKHGWIVAKGENFEFVDSPGVPRRFYGNNLTWSYPQLPRERIRKLARDLTRNGYNAVRLHYWDIMMTDGVGDGTTIPEDRLIAFDGFMKEMIDAGIYVATDLFTSRRIPYRELGIDRDGFVAMDEFKDLLLYHEPAVSNLETYVRQLLTHRNVHTGRDYAHEPALAWYCFVNEGNPGNFFTRYSSRHPYMKREWVKWLRKKKADDPAYGDVPETLPADCRALDIHAAAFRRFLRFLETRFDSRMKAFVRSLGSKALVSSMNAWFNPPSYQLIRNDVYDYVDDHFYIDHPRFSAGRGYPTMCAGVNPVADGRAGVPGAIARRLLDRPFTVTEYNYSVPGRFRGAGGLLMGAFASLQNWSGVWRFCLGKDPGLIEDPNRGWLRFHDTWVDPMMRASEYPFAALFLRGDLAPSGERLAVTLPRRDLERLHVEPVSGGFPWSSIAWHARTGTLVSDAAPEGLSFGYPETYGMTQTEARNRLVPKLGAHALIAGGAVSLDEERGTLAVDTPRTCGVFLEKGVLSAGFLTADVGNVPAAVWAVSHDGRPLKEASRILLGHLTDALQAGTTFVGEDVTCLLRFGRVGELLVRNARAQIRLGLEPGTCTVWALSSGGRRVAKVPSVRGTDGWLEFTASVARDPGNATYLYEIVHEKK